MIVKCSAPGCEQDARVRGACSSHYYYLTRYGQFERPVDEMNRERFWRRVDVGEPDECWFWMMRLDSNGYGHMSIRAKHCAAHRLAWEFTNGPVPDGRWVLHHCDNPPCCNPAHLYIGHHAENTLDAIERDRYKHGELHPRAKLTKKQVDEIRRLRKEGWKYRDLAEKFGVSITTAQQAFTGARWGRDA